MSIIIDLRFSSPMQNYCAKPSESEIINSCTVILLRLYFT